MLERDRKMYPSIVYKSGINDKYAVNISDDDEKYKLNGMRRSFLLPGQQNNHNNCKNHVKKNHRNYF